MAAKTVSLSEDAYNMLKAEKKRGESCSDVVKRIVGKKSLSSFSGAWSKLSDEKIKEIMSVIKKERAISEKKRT